MDFQVNVAGGLGYMTFGKNSDIRTSMYMSLATKQGTFFQNPAFGSQLYKVKKVTDRNLDLAKQYITMALAWLINTGKASTIDIVVEKDSIDFNRMNIRITATQPNSVTVYYQQYFDVRAGTLIWQPVGGPSPDWVPV